MVNIVEILQLAIILAVSIGLHEYAHAYVSHILWDPTPKLQGRLTPNPLKHIDPVGFLMIFLIHFGWGKPVQINPMYYKHPLKGELMVALAGPATNLVLAIGAILILLITSKITGAGLNALFSPEDIFYSFWMMFAFINISLAVFNLLPIPPLDGFRLIKMFWWKAASFIEQYSLYISIAFLVLIMGPGSSIIGNFLSTISTWIFNVLFMILGQVFY